MTIQNRLADIRTHMKEHNLDAVVIDSADPHMSEYLPEHWQGRAWASGFTGSVGQLVVLKDSAYLWTDSRYWLQADSQLNGTTIELKKMGKDERYSDFLMKSLTKGSTVAIDGDVVSVDEFDRLKSAFQDTIALHLTDVLSDIWQDRPALPNAKIYAHNAKFIDTCTSDKLAQVKTKMADLGADNHLISSLDDIAWLTNLRGSDVKCNPVFLSHLLITPQKTTLYTHYETMGDEAKEQMIQANVTLKAYECLADDVATLQGSLLIDKKKVAFGTLKAMPEAVSIIDHINPSTLLKAIKTDKELEHIQDAMVQDGVALCEFFADFENRLAKGERLSELDIAQRLDEYRSRQPNYVGESFDTIAGFLGNGAIVHYKADENNFRYLDGEGLLLIDSGCQYENGTTDITRMSFVGEVCDAAKRDVTYVLKAHIALAKAVFPVDCPSPMLDVLARMPMWEQGLDYGHGTGHGVGYFLNVHEGPQSIAFYAPQTPERVMKKGMVTSNEPGLYRTNQWGVRIENLVACVDYCSTQFGEFLKFEDLTLCPIDTRLILPELLTDSEKQWLNAYHQKVYNALVGLVSDTAKDWLTDRTAPI